MSRSKRFFLVMLCVATSLVLIYSYGRYDRMSSLQSDVADFAVDRRVWRSPMDELLALSSDGCDCLISPFDDLFYRICYEYDNDWRLLSAMAHHESRFRSDVKSYSGAVGLMQIMPRTGVIYGVTVDELLDPETNILVANLHYNAIEGMLSLPDEVSERDRMSLILASYNGGIGRLFDAQRLARMGGENPYLWSVVSRKLLDLRHPEYYTLSIIRSGRFSTATQTVAYVTNVMCEYDIYCEMTSKCTAYIYPMPTLLY